MIIIFFNHVKLTAQTKMFSAAHIKNNGAMLQDSTGAFVNIIYLLERQSCKAAVLIPVSIPGLADTGWVVCLLKKQILVPAKHPLITIKGNIMYDVYYRSSIDTPYVQKDVYQHTVQAFLDVTYKDNYPFRVYITRRFGNSLFTPTFTDLNLQFDPYSFVNNIKKRLIDSLMNNPIADSIKNVKERLEAKRNELAGLKNWMSNPATLQKLVEERERKGVKKWVDNSLSKDKRIDSLQQHYNLDTLSDVKDSYTKSIDNKRKKIDSLQQRLNLDTLNDVKDRYTQQFDSNRKKVDSLQQQIKHLDSIFQELAGLDAIGKDRLRQAIQQAKSGDEIKKRMQEAHLDTSMLPKGFNTLLAVRTFGIGRSIADYSELSVKNTSITGLQLEYNPNYYFAIVAGSVDYRFRDYIITNTKQPKQWLTMLRFGKGQKDGNHLIASWYTGKKQLYNSVYASSGTAIPNYGIMGITLEARYNINPTTYLTAEIAKSSLPYYSGDSTHKPSLTGNMLKVNDRSNEAYAFTLNSYIPFTKTRLTGTYRHTGANFQSFSLFTNGVEQSAWSAKVEQPFFKRKLSIIAGIRENDLVNSFTGSVYKSNAILKSIQASMRIKKLPVITVGYYPSSQLTKLGDGRFSENYFYTFTASAMQFYKLKKTQFNTALIYTQFYNNSSDSGFVYYNTRNLLLAQTAFLGRFTLQTNLTFSSNNTYELYVVDQSAGLRIKKWLQLGGGIKYNKQTFYNIQQWGYSATASVKIPFIGDIQLMYDKGFLPGAGKQLVENNIGRVTYFKTF